MKDIGNESNSDMPFMEEEEDGEIIEDEDDISEDSDDLNELIRINTEEECEEKEAIREAQNESVTARRNQITPTPLNSISTGPGFKPARQQ